MTAWIKKRIGWKWSLAIVLSLLVCAGAAISGGLDDAAFGVGTSRVNEQACMFDDTTPDSVNEGDQGVCRMSANRNQYMTLRDASGQERGVNVTSGNAMEIDVAEQSLTAVKVSATAAANTLGNPMFMQISQDGTNAMATAYPLPVSATVAANTLGNPIFTQLSQDGTNAVATAYPLPVSATVAANTLGNPIFTQLSQDGTNAVATAYPLPVSATTAANATGNRIWTTSNVDQLGGVAITLNTGVVGTGVQRVTLATDDVVSISDDDSANTATNPIFFQPTDGTAVNAVGNPIYCAVSDDTSANAINNPMFFQLSQDGTNAVDATHPVPVSATAAANAVGNPLYASVSKDTSANATGNRMWVTSNIDQLGGNAITVNGGAKDTGVQTVTLATDDPAVLSLGTLDNAIIVDDAGFTPATSSVSMMGCEYDDTTPDSVNEGDGGAVRMSANRSMYVEIRDGSDNERALDITATGGAEVDIATQTLTAVKVSATAAANTLGNPMFTQLSQDGTNAVATAYPLPVSATTAANATGNRIYTNANVDQIGGSALAFGESNAAGSLPCVLASDKYVRVSDDTNANAINNPMFFQMSQDGTNAVDATHPIPISSTLAANAVGNPIYASVSATGAANALNNPMFVQISQDGTNAVATATPLPVSATTAANATGNRIYVNGNIDQVAGAALGLGEDTAAASVPVVLASDKYVRVSDDTNANTATNPMFFQPTDGTAVNAVANPIYAAVSKDNAANATGNRIWTAANVDQIGGAAYALGEVAAASAAPVVLANDKYVRVSDDTSANSETNPIYTEKIAPVLDADDTAACLAIAAAEADYTVTHDQTQICASGNTVYILCANAAPVTADHTVGNFSIVVPDGMCLGPYDFTGLTVCSYIGVAAAGFVCFLGSDYN